MEKFPGDLFLWVTFVKVHVEILSTSFMDFMKYGQDLKEPKKKFEKERKKIIARSICMATW